jgi:tRNA(Arg) A34 adenosine deaminase TadA
MLMGQTREPAYDAADLDRFMREAIALSRRDMESGLGGPFGAVIVKDGFVIARGSNRVTSTNDPTAHAEIVAIRNACTKLESFSLAGCTLFTSCEPCPMCLGAVYWARLDRLYFANTRADAAAIDFSDDYIYRELALPLHERSVPFEQHLRDEALPIFAQWQAKSDKIVY